MSISLKFRVSLITALLLSLGACSSSNSNDPVQDDANNAENPAEQGPLVPAAGEPLSDPVTDTPDPVDPSDEPADDPENEAPAEGGEQDPPADNQPAPLIPPPAPGSNPDDQPAQQPDPVDDPVEEPSDEPVEGDPSEDPADAPPESDPADEPPEGDPVDQPTGILDPPVIRDGDLDRLIKSLTGLTSMTLLDLNARISQGQPLSDRENLCLGAYEEGLGEPLTAIDCGDEQLAVADARVKISVAAFYATPECLESLFNGVSDACVLREISMSVSPKFTPSASGAPALGYPGAELDYAIDDTALKINNDDDALKGVFNCEIELENVAVTSENGADNCDNTVRLLANEMESIVGE
ncbi:MAG: hypothetical protein AB8B87_20830 [Granulosicoccus sp.]